MIFKEEFEGLKTHSSLMGRMTNLVNQLRPYQRDYHVVLQVDMYWYIQKHKEIEMLISRLADRCNTRLSEYLNSVCEEVQKRIDADEKFINDHNKYVDSLSRKNNHEESS